MIKTSKGASQAGPKSFRVRYWLIGGFVALAALVVIGSIIVRRQTSVAAMEQRIHAALGPEGDSLYRIRVGSSHLSILGRTYLATDIEILPDTAAFRQRREAGRPVRVSYSLRAGSFRVTGLDVWGLLRNRLVSSAAVIDSMEIEAYLDRTVSGPPDPVRRLPHEFFWTIPKPFRVDTFRIANSDVRYSERAIDGARPGTIRFASTNVGVYNLNNDSLRPNTPVVIDVHTLLAGAPTAAIFEYDFRTPQLNLNYHGTVTDLDAGALNAMTVNLEGLRLTGGHMDSTRFDFRVKDGVANGEVVMHYRHLKAEVVDKVTRHSGFAEWVKSLVANTFVIKGHNRSDGDHFLRTGTVRGFVRPPALTLSKFVWHTLREGLFITITGAPPVNSRGL